MGKLISIPSDSPDNNSDSDSDLNVLTDEPENCCVRPSCHGLEID